METRLNKICRVNRRSLRFLYQLNMICRVNRRTLSKIFYGRVNQLNPKGDYCVDKTVSINTCPLSERGNKTILTQV